MTGRQRADRPGQDGAALVMVLVFVLVVAVLIGALLNQSYTVFRAGRVSTQITEGVLAANGGVDWALQQVTRGVAIDGAPGCVGLAQGIQTVPGSIVVNGRTVTVTCEVVAGHGVGAGGWAAFVTGAPAGGVTVYAGTEKDKVIDGAVHNASTFARIGEPILRLLHGDLTSCPGVPEGWVQQPLAPYTVETTCAPAGTALPDPPIDTDAHLAGAGIVDAAATDPRGSTIDRCRVFQPGRYADGGVPALLARDQGSNYFRSGVYYFDSLDTVTWSDAIVVGGIPAEREQPLTQDRTTAETDCGGQFQQGADTGGHYGVVFVFGGNTRLELGSGTSLELFSYVEPLEGASGGLSVLQLDHEWPSGTSTVVGANETVLSTALGSAADVAFHGTVYAPAARVSAFGTTDSRVSFLGGVVAAGLDLQAGAHDAGAHVSTRSGPGSRTIRFVATANGVGGSRKVTSDAVVEVTNDAARTVRVTSWSVEQ